MLPRKEVKSVRRQPPEYLVYSANNGMVKVFLYHIKHISGCMMWIAGPKLILASNYSLSKINAYIPCFCRFCWVGISFRVSRPVQELIAYILLQCWYGNGRPCRVASLVEKERGVSGDSYKESMLHRVVIGCGSRSMELKSFYLGFYRWTQSGFVSYRTYRSALMMYQRYVAEHFKTSHFAVGKSLYSNAI